jgi:lipopolysaccharide exporter
MKKIINKASILSTALSNQLIILTFNVVLFVIIAKSFSSSVLAGWAIFQSVSTIADMIRVGFIQNSLINQLKSNTSNTYNIIKSAWLVYIGISTITAILVMVIFQLISIYGSHEYIFDYVPYYMFSVIGIGSLQFINIIKQAKEQHSVIAKNNLAWVLLSFIVLGIFYQLHNVNPSTILITTGISAGLVSSFYIIKNIHRFLLASIDTSIFFKMIDFGKYVFGTNLLSMLINKSDIFILGFFCQPGNLAAYHIAIRIANYLEIPLNAAAQVFYPKLHNAFSNKITLEKVITESLLIQWIYIIPAALLLFIFSGSIINLIASSEYINESSTLLRIIILASFIKPIGRTMGIVLDIKDRPDLNLQILLFSGILFIALEIFLGINYSSTGIAIANVLASWISILIAQLFLNKKINISLIQPVYKLLIKKLKNKSI